MDHLKRVMLDMIQSRFPLEPTPISEDLQTIRLPLGFLSLRLDNWRAPKVRKVNVMRTTVKLPRLTSWPWRYTLTISMTYRCWQSIFHA